MASHEETRTEMVATSSKETLHRPDRTSNEARANQVRLFRVKLKGFIVPYNMLTLEGMAYPTPAILVIGHNTQSPAVMARTVKMVSDARVFKPLDPDVEVVRLSWKWLTRVPFEFVLDISHVYHRLYLEVMDVIKVKYPPEVLTHPIETSRTVISEHHPSFGTLVNLLANKLMLPLSQLKDFIVDIRPDSTVDFIFTGILFVIAMRRRVASGPAQPFFALEDALENGLGNPQLYHALFLDLITPLWEQECWSRLQTKWSPMPWSKISQKDATRLYQDVTPLHAPTAAMLDAVDFSKSEYRLARAALGCPMDIPWLGCHHDGYPFFSSLSNYVKARRSDLPTLHDDTALWLGTMTFGFLEAITRTKIPEDLLLSKRESDGLLVISGERLLRLAALWRDHLLYRPWASDEARDKWGDSICQMLTWALLVIDEEGGAQSESPVLQRTGQVKDDLFAFLGPVIIMMLTFAAYAHSVWDEELEYKRILTRNTQRKYHYIVERAVQMAMRDRGWCLYTVPIMFMAPMKRADLTHLVRLEPYIRQAQDEHRGCGESSCVIYNITDPTSYTPKHTDPSCNCGYTRPPFDEVQRLLSQGDIPVLVFDGNHLNVRSAFDGPYLAISHVWADGLGSVTETGLPTCQVSRLAAFACDLVPETGAFWVDSLCVPESKELRKGAIKLMARTYDEAASVLVVDASIRARCSQTCSWQENLFRIATSGWVRRIWTLQEGLLARKLYFEFSDGPVDVEEKLAFFGSHIKDGYLNFKEMAPSFELVSHHLCEGYLPLLAFRTNNKGKAASQQCTLHEVVRMLQLRTTSKAEDETVAISGLLPGIDLGALLSINGPDAAALRMKSFYLQSGYLPKTLPLLAAPKLSMPSFRWAPLSLANVLDARTEEYGTALCTEEGLLGEYIIINFDKPVQIPWPYTSTEPLNIYIAHYASESVYMVQVGELHTWVPVNLNGPFMLNALLIVHRGPLSDSITPCAVVSRTVAPDAEDGSDADEELLHCEYITHGLLFRVGPSPDEWEATRDVAPEGVNYVKGVFREVSVLLT